MDGNLLNRSNTLIPEEIVTEILLRLPVKSLWRFTCVCKSWRTLLSSSYFKKAHLNISKNSKNYANHNVIFFSAKHTRSTFTCPLSAVLDNNATLHPKLFYCPSVFQPWIYGSCNGLLCVQGDNSTLLLYNPTTRKSKILPASGTQRNHNSLFTCGLCYHELDDDYRVVEVHESSDGKVKVYSLKINSWRKINGDQVKATTYRLCTKRPGLPVGGVLHWVIRNDDNLSLCQIFGVDIVTYRYRTLVGPKYVGTTRAFWGIMDFRGCLGVYHTIEKTGVDIWIMKESWTKVLTLPYGVGTMSYHQPIVGLKDGVILLDCNIIGSSLVYNSREGSFIRHVIPEHVYVSHFSRSPLYIESLVAPCFDGE